MMKFLKCENCQTLLRKVDLKEWCNILVCPACGCEVTTPPIVLSVYESEKYEYI